MKKLITLLIVLICCVGTVGATTRVFIKANSWANDGATFKMNFYKSGSYQANVKMTNLRNDIYYADANDDYDAFQILRMDAGYNSQWNYTANCTINGSKLYIMGSIDDNYSAWDASDYLPTNYYFASSLDNWASATKMDEETSGTFTHEFTTATYAGKYFVWAPGDAFSSAGVMTDWNRVIRPKLTTDQYSGYKNNHWVLFQILSYADGTSQIFDGTNAADANIWYVPTTDEPTGENSGYVAEGSVVITFNKETNSATIIPKKSASISSALYATWSNGEKYTVSGATAYTVSDNNTSYVTLTEQSAGTIFAGGTGAGTGILLNGESGATVTINAVAGDAEPTNIGTNYLYGTGNSAQEITATDYTYVFANDATNGVGFYKASSNGTLAAHKAYLDLPGDPAGARADFLGFSFDEETTGITEVRSTQSDGAIYNMQGVRLSKFQKGLNIVNGKKILVK